MGILNSKVATRLTAENEMEEYLLSDSSSARKRYFTQCVPLHDAALKGDWEAARRLLDNDPSLISAHITEGGETALHIAAIEGHENFVTHLLHRMKKRDDSGTSRLHDHLQIFNKKGNTALTFAATGGHLQVAKLMVQEFPDLPNIKDPSNDNAVTPLYMAVEMGHHDVANYLFSMSHEDFISWSEQDQLEILLSSIKSGLYDLARSIVTMNKKLVVLTDEDGCTPLQALAHNPSAFYENTSQPAGLFQIIATTGVHALMRLTREEEKSKEPPSDAYALFDCLWKSIISVQDRDIENGEVIYDEKTISVMFTAAESGNYPFLVKLISKDRGFMYKVNDKNYSIFHIAILKRHADIFNLIYEAEGMKNLIVRFVDPDGNNMLHLAAKMAPPNTLSDIPGAALQMQRQVLWYKNVEKVHPLNRNEENHKGQTTRQLFLTEHKQLMKDGEKEMKKLAQYFMVVTTLITTVVFASAFTVPGGYDNDTGVPILLEKRSRLFVFFPIFEALATLSSLVSMLMFLLILTSPYRESDFLTKLPLLLVTGVMMLFVSFISMVATFCSSLLPYKHELTNTIMVLMGLFCCVPIIFVALKHRLLFGVVRHTFGSRRLFVSTCSRLP